MTCGILIPWGCALLLIDRALFAAALEVTPHRPAASPWRRTQCGGPSGVADLPTRWASDVSPDKTPLDVYPRPQTARKSKESPAIALEKLRDAGDSSTWFNLNGLWEWEPATSEEPQFGKALNASILVPFPVESCLSGVAPKSSKDVVTRMWYRLTFDYKAPDESTTLLNFGAVDWQTTVYFNKVKLGTYTGGYSGFTFDLTEHLVAEGNELLVYVYDPSDLGHQPNGKQVISRIDSPGGDTYTPSSGIWQTVWLESVPSACSIAEVKIQQSSLTAVTLTADVIDDGFLPGAPVVTFTVMDGDVEVASGTVDSTVPLSINVPSPKLWTPDSPHLYDVKVTSCDDVVFAYFGLRTFTLGKNGNSNVTRPLLNGNFTFLAGFLDQSWWPDGQYTAPTDEALESDLLATKKFGMNMIRLHQKVNPERWYYHADRHGVVVFQDMVQKYGNADKALVPLFMEDMESTILGRRNHPCIVQWETFNENDCWHVFNVTDVVRRAKQLDPTRLVDADSGGGANGLHVADVNDIHSYPYPGDPQPNATQYAMVGEFGGIGAFIAGKEWVPGKCHTYLKASNPADAAKKYAQMAETLLKQANHVSASVVTQTTDVELECDGFLNYDRSDKFNAEQTKAIYDANRAIINARSGAMSVQTDGHPEPVFI